MVEASNAADEALAYARELAGRGRTVQARELCEQLLAVHPEHPATLNFLGELALDGNQPKEAARLFHRARELAPDDLAALLNLALAEMASGRMEAALARFEETLARDPRHALALIHKGRALELAGRPREAVETWYLALEEANRQELWNRPETTPPALRALLARATVAVRRARERFLRERLHELRERHGDAALARVWKCLDLYLGKRPLEFANPEQRPSFLVFPDIPSRNFFRREEFPELRNIEAKTALIRDELAAVMNVGEGFRPFIDMPPGPAAEHWRRLNRSADWNAFFFWRDGERNEENCRRCPETAASLDALDLNRVPGHSPESIFSVLTPGTHIPPHHGVTNTRLVCHLPLVIPENCAIRVGGEERGWTEGECLIFDDTFRHEAWNRSDRIRVVLIFDLWNPYLTPVEREAMSILVPAAGAFNRQMVR
ncbi:MAG TPA: aspartyl/asparaginyl beta-hydroxylase domain-containing protein [Gammaproteobacteria bacterium]|nr:aspartyl/asparaginyl beta-hydroxylase domain-containing protein [Gammaproteobacteria bacterium]